MSTKRKRRSLSVKGPCYLLSRKTGFRPSTPSMMGNFPSITLLGGPGAVVSGWRRGRGGRAPRALWVCPFTRAAALLGRASRPKDRAGASVCPRRALASERRGPARGPSRPHRVRGRRGADGPSRWLRFPRSPWAPPISEQPGPWFLVAGADLPRGSVGLRLHLARAHSQGSVTRKATKAASRAHQAWIPGPVTKKSERRSLSVKGP